jgi:hypothetical protein
MAALFRQRRHHDDLTTAGGFSGDFMREMEALMGAMPSGVAQLRIIPSPTRPCLELSGAHFEVTPTNPKAARFSGDTLARDLNLTVGEAQREFIGFARGGNFVRGANWKEELRWIWQAVVAGHFTQRHYLNSSGKVIGAACTLQLNGRDIVFRGGARAERLFGKENVRTVTYEAYI